MSLLFLTVSPSTYEFCSRQVGLPVFELYIYEITLDISFCICFFFGGGAVGSQFTDQELNPRSLQWKHWIWTTRSPGNSHVSGFFLFNIILLLHVMWVYVSFSLYIISHFGIHQNLAIPLLCINFVVVNNPLISLAYNNKHLFLALHIVNYISLGSFLCVFSFQDTE